MTKLYKLHQHISNLKYLTLKTAELTNNDWITTLQVTLAYDQRPYIFVVKLGGLVTQCNIRSTDSFYAVPSVLLK